MRRIIGVLSVLLLSIVTTDSLAAQDGARPVAGEQANGFQLEQNYPNPFNPETTIPFTLGEDLFVDGPPSVVTVRIFNLLQQLVAHPIAPRPPSGEAQELRQVEYPIPGRCEAYRDGTDLSGRQVASGIYFMQLTVNGRSETRKMYVLK